jgi:hypothetical protein
MPLARDIGDGRLLKTDLTEQAFRDLDNQLMSVILLGFSFRPHSLRRQDCGLGADYAFPLVAGILFDILP